MKNLLVSFMVGFTFAIGLGISGMTQPQKIIGFLDFFGSWDPTLIFVMLGAISVHFIAFKLITKRKSPLLASEWLLSSKKEITPALVVGSLLFGIGWGLGGYCPGPAVTSLASFQIRPLIFIISMLFGMLLFNQVDKKVKFRK